MFFRFNKMDNNIFKFISEITIMSDSEKYSVDFYTFYTNYKNGLITLHDKGVGDFINRVLGLYMINVFTISDKTILFSKLYDLTLYINENIEEPQIFNEKNILNFFKSFASDNIYINCLKGQIIQQELSNLINLVLVRLRGIPKKQIFLKTLINIAYNNLDDIKDELDSTVSKNISYILPEFSSSLGKIIHHELINYTHWLEQDYYKKLMYIINYKTGISYKIKNDLFKYASKYESRHIYTNFTKSNNSNIKWKSGFYYKNELRKLFAKISNLDTNENIKLLLNRFNSTYNHILTDYLMNNDNKIVITIDAMNIFYSYDKKGLHKTKMLDFIESINNGSKDLEIRHYLQEKKLFKGSGMIDNLEIKYLLVFNEKHKQHINSILETSSVNIDNKIEVVYCHKFLNDDIMQLYLLLWFENTMLISNDKHSNYIKTINQDYYYRDLFKNIKENWQLYQNKK